MASIRQNPRTDALRDFCNPGLIVRVLIAVNALAFGVILAAKHDLARAAKFFLRAMALVGNAQPAGVPALQQGSGRGGSRTSPDNTGERLHMMFEAMAGGAAAGGGEPG